MMAKYLLSIVLLVFFSILGYAQKGVEPSKSKQYPDLRTVFINDGLEESLEFNFQLERSSSKIYKSKEAFFCRIEREFEKLAKINTRFRIGDLSTVNKLEGK